MSFQCSRQQRTVTMINFLEKINFNGYTFILPSVSVGNVGQLATDLLISTLSMRKVGTLWDPSIIPIIGPPAYGHEMSITTASDMYVSEEKKIVILQLRSPLVSALMGALFDKLTDFIVKQNFIRLIILTGSFAHERHVIDGNLFEYQATQIYCDKFGDKLEGLKRYDSEVLHGSGFASKLLRVAGLKNIPTLTLFKYVSEGDNIPDAVDLLGCLDKILDIVPRRDDGYANLIHPTSWKHLYGNAPPKKIY